MRLGHSTSQLIIRMGENVTSIHWKCATEQLGNYLATNRYCQLGVPCARHSAQLDHINYSRMDLEEVMRRMQHGRRHQEFCVKLYHIQHEVGRYFLHEHPAGASSWEENCTKKLMNMRGVTRVVGDQCRYGLLAKR